MKQNPFDPPSDVKAHDETIAKSWEPIKLYRRLSNGLAGVVLMIFGIGIVIGDLHSGPLDGTLLYGAFLPGCALVPLGVWLIFSAVFKS